jgi:hypothetical protein
VFLEFNDVRPDENRSEEVRLAEAAHCARSTVAEAVKALEERGFSHGSSGSSGCASSAVIFLATTGGADGFKDLEQLRLHRSFASQLAMPDVRA